MICETNGLDAYLIDNFNGLCTDQLKDKVDWVIYMGDSDGEWAANIK